MNVLNWIGEHPFLTLILVCVIGEIVGNTIIYSIRAWRGKD